MTTTSICRDVDCPTCGWPETYAEVDFDAPTPGADAIGCRQCGWRVEASEPNSEDRLLCECGEDITETDQYLVNDAAACLDCWRSAGSPS